MLMLLPRRTYNSTIFSNSTFRYSAAASRISTFNPICVRVCVNTYRIHVAVIFCHLRETPSPYPPFPPKTLRRLLAQMHARTVPRNIHTESQSFFLVYSHIWLSRRTHMYIFLQLYIPTYIYVCIV